MNASVVTRFGDLTDAAAARWGDREALVFRQRRYSFRQIAAEVDRVARGLIRAGARPGETVAIWLVNCPEWMSPMLALAKTAAAAVRPTDTVFIMYTSGTTGFPTGVMRDHSLLAHLADRYRRLQSSERDVFVNYLPLFHIFGYVDGPLGSMLAGYRQILTDTFDPDEALDLIEREGATHIDGFDTHLKLLVDAQESRPRNLSTLRTGVIAAGAASATPIVYRARKVLAPLRHLTAYGMTEVGEIGRAHV